MQHTIQYSTVKYITVQYNTVQYSTVQYSMLCFSNFIFSFLELFQEKEDNKGVEGGGDGLAHCVLGTLPGVAGILQGVPTGKRKHCCGY